MKKPILLLIALLLPGAGFQAVANPFACKIVHPLKSGEKRAIEELIFKGYAILDEHRFAVVQIGDRQYSLKAGEQVGDITILEVAPAFLAYRKRQRVFRVSSEKPPNSETIAPHLK